MVHTKFIPDTLLNEVLRTDDTRSILLFRFFIIDSCQQLADKYGESCNGKDEDDLSSTNYVYRGQLMPRSELDSLRKSLGNIISMKSFLSTSLDQQMALFYLGDSNDECNQSSMVRTLIRIDLGQSNRCYHQWKPFGNITEQGYFGDTGKEVLFMVGTSFHVDEIRACDENGIWHVHLSSIDFYFDLLHTLNRWSELCYYMQKSFIP